MLLNVLIAEDEKNLGRLLKMMLSCGLPKCRIDLVINGAEAIDAFRKGRHNVLLLDLQMPVKNGYQVFQEIWNICEKEKIEMPFVIFCTGYPVADEIEEIASYTSRYRILQKPVSSELLIETVSAGLQ